MRKVSEQQTTFEQGGFDGSGLIVDGDANNPNAGSTVKSWAINDVIGAFSAILKAAGINSFNGQPETEDSSQVLAAIQHLIDSQKNIMDAKINALREELQTQYAALAGNNIFTGNNEFKAPLSTEEAVNHTTMPNHNNIDLIDKGDLEAKNYADKNYVSGSIAENNKTLVKLDKGTSSIQTEWEIGSIILGWHLEEVFKMNQQVWVEVNSNDIQIHNHSFDHAFKGVWRCRGIGFVEKNGNRKIVLAQRVS